MILGYWLSAALFCCTLAGWQPVRRICPPCAGALMVCILHHASFIRVRPPHRLYPLHVCRAAGSEEFAESKETAFTEELDGSLRRHRPRAGQLEEVTRQSRSVELLGQKRRMEAHLRAMSRSVKEQQARRAAAAVDRLLDADQRRWRPLLLAAALACACPVLHASARPHGHASGTD